MKRLRAVLPAAVTLLFIAFVTAVTASHGTQDTASGMTHLSNSPRTGTTNSDLAFWGKLVFAGNYGGFRIIDASTAKKPVVLADVRCSGSQGDVGVYGTPERRLLFVSVDSPQARGECSPGPADPNRWEGIRIWDVTDPRNPQFIKAVSTDCGSHTHTVVPDHKNRRAFIYVSSYILGAPAHRCPDSDGAPTHSKISIIEVSLAAPENAQVVNEAPLPSPNGCHDIGVFLEIKRAAAACITEGQIWDISDPVHPVVLHRIVNPAINIWHSGAFTWDGKYAVFGDEEGGAVMTHACTPPRTPPGAVWFYEVANPTVPAGSFALPRAQGPDGELTCTIHNYTVVPVRNKYLLLTAAYQAGTSLIDFTNPANAQEIAYYDAQGLDGNPSADTWSSYWYNDMIYANDISRGVDIFRLTDMTMLGGKTAKFMHLNPQTQWDLLD